MVNFKKLSLLFMPCLLLVCVVSTVLCGFLSKYDVYKDVTVNTETNYFSITDKPMQLFSSQEVISNVSPHYLIIKIKDNDRKEGKVYLTIYDEKKNIIKDLPNFSYNSFYKGYDITSFQGQIKVPSAKATTSWQVKIAYVDYYNSKFLNPVLIAS